MRGARQYGVMTSVTAKLVLLPLLGGVIAGIICLVGALNRFPPGGEPPRAAEDHAAPSSAWSWLVETLNDPYLIAVVLICLIGLLVPAGRMRWNEWYVATHPHGVETSGQIVVGSREDAELQARLDAWLRRHSTQIPKRH